jgi:hypothetical protein
MPSNLPSRANQYRATSPDMELSPEVWDGTLSDIGARLDDLEALRIVYDEEILRLQTQALATIQSSMTAEINVQRANLEALQADYADFEAAFSQILSGGINANVVTLPAIGDLTATNAEDAFAEIVDKIENLKFLPLAGGQMLEPIVFADDQKFPSAYSAAAITAGAVTLGDPLAYNVNGTVSVVSERSEPVFFDDAYGSIGTSLYFTHHQYVENQNLLVSVYNGGSGASYPYMYVYRWDIDTASETATILSATSANAGSSVTLGSVSTDGDRIIITYQISQTVYAKTVSFPGGVTTVEGPVNVMSSITNSRASYDSARQRMFFVGRDSASPFELWARTASLVSGNYDSLGAEYSFPDIGGFTTVRDAAYDVAAGVHVVLVREASTNIDKMFCFSVDENDEVTVGSEYALPFDIDPSQLKYIPEINRVVTMCSFDRTLWFGVVNITGTAVASIDWMPLTFTQGEKSGGGSPHTDIIFDRNINALLVSQYDPTANYFYTQYFQVVQGELVKGTWDFYRNTDDVIGHFFDPVSSRRVMLYRASTAIRSAVVQSAADNRAAFAGFAAADAADGETVAINPPGSVDKNQNGLVKGVTYYLSASGGLTSFPTEHKAGTALSATAIKVG